LVRRGVIAEVDPKDEAERIEAEGGGKIEEPQGAANDG